MKVAAVYLGAFPAAGYRRCARYPCAQEATASIASLYRGELFVFRFCKAHAETARARLEAGDVVLYPKALGIRER